MLKHTSLLACALGCSSPTPLEPGWISLGDFGLRAKAPSDTVLDVDGDTLTIDLMNPEIPARILVKRKRDYFSSVKEATAFASEYEDAHDFHPTELADGWTLTWKNRETSSNFVVMAGRKIDGTMFSCESTTTGAAGQRAALELCTSLAKR